jgi:hypothetical protein
MSLQIKLKIPVKIAKNIQFLYITYGIIFTVNTLDGSYKEDKHQNLFLPLKKETIRLTNVFGLSITIETLKSAETCIRHMKR